MLPQRSFGILLATVLCGTNVVAQDRIVLRDGSEISSKVLEIGVSEIKYKRFDNLDGPTYVVEKATVQKVIYQNGSVDEFKVRQPARPNNADSASVKPIRSERPNTTRTFVGLGGSMGGPELGGGAVIDCWGHRLRGGYYFFTTYQKGNVATNGQQYDVYLFQHTFRLAWCGRVPLDRNKATYFLYSPVGVELAYDHFKYHVLYVTEDSKKTYMGTGLNLLSCGFFIPFRPSRPKCGGMMLTADPLNFNWLGKDYPKRQYWSINLSIVP